MEVSECVLSGLTRIVMRGGDARHIHDGGATLAGGVEYVRALFGLARIVMRGDDLHTGDDFGLTGLSRGLLVPFVTVSNTSLVRSIE